LRVLGVASASGAALSATGSTAEVDRDFLLDFLAARLRGDFGSIAMAPNPLARIRYFLVAIRILVAHRLYLARLALLGTPCEISTVSKTYS
jgi:hypothetical protein